ncbi:class I SAM-dependent methyltransferase [Enterovirga rhinocerotis]|uniref:Methyltransferase family protein n=1 Tax=Enterovirga rhinocerotis TaxID=1339210 RepID=A0A4R7BTS7_9HYPH|nr:class I SAM-dependent methyltransferase [Enterovirga rhinocerotis]TDR88901.1 methyltransferase family protein [Enterovirga rhinocerotis]
MRVGSGSSFDNALDAFRSGRFEVARRILLEAVSSDTHPKWFALLASTEARLQNWDGAIEQLRSAIRLSDKRNLQWSRQMAAYLMKAGRHADAHAVLTSLVYRGEDIDKDRGLLAQLHFMRCEWSLALDLIDSTSWPDDVVPLHLRAMAAECRSRLAGPDDAGERTSRQLSSAYYDVVYSGSAEYAADSEDSIYAPVWSTIVERIEPSSVVLDIGCGPGQFAAFLHARRPSVLYTGIDFSATAIAQARSRCSAVSFVQADIFDPKSLDGIGYDTVVATEFLEHVDDDLGVLSRLRSGAAFIGSVPNFDSISHVRYFSSEIEVLARYRDVVEDLAVKLEPCGRNALFVMTGRIA